MLSALENTTSMEDGHPEVILYVLDSTQKLVRFPQSPPDNLGYRILFIVYK